MAGPKAAITIPCTKNIRLWPCVHVYITMLVFRSSLNYPNFYPRILHGHYSTKNRAVSVFPS